MSLRLTGAVFAVLCLSVSAQAAPAECLSRPSIQPQLYVLINPLADVLTSVATGTTAPAGVDGCWRKVK